MGAFRDNVYNSALRLLTNFGQSISATRDNVGAFVPALGTVSDLADTTYSGYGYPSNYNTLQIDGTLVQQNDTLLIFSSTTAPLVNDVFVVGSKSYTALSIQNVSAQGENVIYKIQLRQ